MNEISKLKASKMNDKWIFNEVSKKQRMPLEDLGADVSTAIDLKIRVTKF